MSQRAPHRNNHTTGMSVLSGLTLGPRVIPNVVGGEPFTILAWEEWMQRANCTDVDPELFYPGVGDAAATRQARRICTGCEVRDKCLEHALARREPFGIWGGLSPRQRREVRAAS